MRAADFIADLGPGAGEHGGQIVATGTIDEVMQTPGSLTGQYLSGKKKVPMPEGRRPGNGSFLTIAGARENNLRNIDVEFPLGLLACITGVSGGGKSSLIIETLYRALAKRLAPQAGKLRRDAMAAGIFLHPDGTPLGEAENLVQVELASVLARIRTRGLSDFYSAEMGRHWLAASTSHGGKATIGDLRGYRAFWQETDRLSVGNEILYFPKLSQAEGPAFKLVALLNAKPLAAAAGKVFGQASVAMTHDRGETGLVVGDSFGSAAACVFQMNDAFGSGAMAPNMGVFLAPSIARGMAGAANWPGHPLPLLGANENVRQVFFAASGTGGPLGAASAAALSRAVMIEGKTLEQIMSANKSAGLDRPDRVQALWCPKGIRDGASSCQFATDARAHGLAVFDQF